MAAATMLAANLSTVVPVETSGKSKGLPPSLSQLERRTFSLLVEFLFSRTNHIFSNISLQNVILVVVYEIRTFVDDFLKFGGREKHLLLLQ